MKRIVLILTLSIFIMMTASAAEPTNPTASLNAKLDLTKEDYVKFNFADSKNSTTPLPTLALKSNSNGTLSGTGSFYIVWDVIYSSPFELRIYSEAMTNSNKDELHWTLKDGLNKIILDKANNYGGTSNNLIYKHDPKTNVIGKKDSLLLNVTTENVSNLSNSEYSTTLIVVFQSK